MGTLNESKRYNDYTDVEKQEIFNVFQKSYEKTMGVSWDINKFNNRAYNWIFFGDINGYVAIRPQNSGYYKFVGVAGDKKSVLRGIQELVATNYPLWGMMTPNLGDMLIKKYGFRSPNKLESYALTKLIPASVFGNVKYKTNSDNTITFDYPDVGTTTKMFVGNKEYFLKIRKDLFNAGKKSLLGNKTVNEEEVIVEKRAVDVDYEAFQSLIKYFNEFGYEDTYVRFTQTVNTGMINRANEYDTPTGYYSYPMKNFKEKMSDVKTIDEFFKIFPFINNSKYANLFTLKDTSSILFSSESQDDKINSYVDSIERQYGGRNEGIKVLCNDFRNNNYNSMLSRSSVFKNSFQKLWLFIYDIAYSYKTGKNAFEAGSFRTYPTIYTNICNSIRLDGFVDDGCFGIIHSNEPCQGVFFHRLRNIIDNMKTIHIIEGEDMPLNFDTKSSENRDRYIELRQKFAKYIAKKNNRGNGVIQDDNYRNLINRGQLFSISLDTIPYLSDKHGNIFNKNIKLENYGKGHSSIFTGAFNSKYHKEYTSVRTYGHEKYYGVLNNKYVLINSEGEPSTEDVNLSQLLDSTLRGAYFNQKYGKHYGEVYKNYEYYYVYQDGKYMFINSEGEPSTEDVKLDQIEYGNALRATYFNQKFGKNYDEVYNNGGSLNNYIYVGGKYMFINSEGELSTEDVELSKINNAEVRAAYFNQKFGKNYDMVSSKINDDVTSYYTIMNNKMYIVNSEGEPIPQGEPIPPVDTNLDNVGDSSSRAAYINKNYGKNFDNVYRTANGYYYVENENGKYTFINSEGEPSTEDIKLDQLNNSGQRALYMNQKFGKNFVNVYKDGDKFYYNGNDGINVYINSEGESIEKNIDENVAVRIIKEEIYRFQFRNK